MIYAYELVFLIRLLFVGIILFSYFHWLESLPVPKFNMTIVEIA